VQNGYVAIAATTVDVQCKTTVAKAWDTSVVCLATPLTSVVIGKLHATDQHAANKDTSTKNLLCVQVICIHVMLILKLLQNVYTVIITNRLRMYVRVKLNVQKTDRQTSLR